MRGKHRASKVPLFEGYSSTSPPGPLPPGRLFVGYSPRDAAPSRALQSGHRRQRVACAMHHGIEAIYRVRPSAASLNEPSKVATLNPTASV